MVIGRRFQFLSVLLTASLVAPPALARHHSAPPTAQNAAKTEDNLLYLRVSEERGKRIALEVAVREFERQESEGPRVALVSIAHVGDRKMYSKIQELLRDYDVVLYEAVTPPGVGRPTGETDEERARNTEKSLRFVAGLTENHRAKHGRYPEDAAELIEHVRQVDGMAVNWLKGALVDAWGAPIIYKLTDQGEGFQLVSLGADLAAGGEPDSPDADIVVDHTAGVSPFQVERDNIQQQLASALDLSYQLAELDYAAPNWRNSDMNIDELAAAFRERGSDFGVMGDAVAGAGFPAALGRMLLGLIGVLDRMMDGVVSDLVKVMLIEVLGDQQMIEETMGQMGAGFSEVLIGLRNQVTMEDLAAIIRDEPEVKSVAILYGAAHMPDFERRLADQLSYEPVGERWIPAIAVDIAASRLDPRQVQQMRTMMRRMIQQQMRQMNGETLRR